MADQLQDLPAATHTVLLASPTLVGSDDPCATLLTGGEGEGTYVMWVSYTRPPGECVRTLQETGVQPEQGVVLVVGEPRGGPTSHEAISVETVENPADLTGLGIAVRRYLDEWPAGHITICFDSLTSLLQYVDVETAYEFLHVLGGQVCAADARAHFHLNPDAHDEQTTALLTTLCDAAVEFDHGGLAVRSRFEG